MVTIIQDKRKWQVVHEYTNEYCPHLYYPANYHGCRLLPMDNDSCTLENCRHKSSKQNVMVEQNKLIEVLKDYLELGQKAYPYIAGAYFYDGKGFQILSQHIKFLQTSHSLKESPDV